MLALTARELEVLALAAEGGTNAEIAAALGLTRLTIKSHMARICRRIDARSREQAVIFGLRAGVIQ